MTTLDPEVARYIREQARRSERLERRVQSVASAPADLRHAALDGAPIVYKDPEGNVVGRQGYDPETESMVTEHVGGQRPPVPEALFVDEGSEVTKMQHSGLDINGLSAPANVRRAVIHVSQDPDFEPGPHSFAGYLESLDGSFTHRLPAGEWHIGVVWQSQSGLLSDMSEVVVASVDPLVNEQDIEDALETARGELEEAKADFEAGNQARKDEIDNLNETILPGLEDLLQKKADSSELGALDQVLRDAFGEADKAIQQAADDARAKAEAAGATAAEADAAAAKAVADAEEAFAKAEAAERFSSDAEQAADASARDAADALAQAQAAGGDATAAQAAADAAQASADAAHGHADTAGTAAAAADAKAAQAAADAAKAQADAVAAAASSGTSAEEAQAAKERADQAAADAAAAYERAQEAEESASSASGAAGAAESAADSAASQAADALARAQAAEGDADAAQAAADEAQRYADTAQSKADEANTAAADADAKAAQAAADAAQAAADAVAAASSSSTSASEAQAAKGRADQAAKDAQAAYTRAQEAEDAAASSAGSASAAETAADTAAANAADALSRAQAAEGDAGAAQKAADDAQRYADEAERKAEKAGTDAASADAKAAKAAADAAQAVADAAQAAQDATKATQDAAKATQDAEAAGATAAEAQAQARESRAAAEAAEARAVDAMSFVSTVLQNGSFEDGLTNWTTSGGAGLVDDITRSGDLAGVLPERGDSLTYDETLTAAAGQVWELSGYYYCGIDPQIGITFTYHDEDGTALETTSEIEMAGRVGVWNSFGPFRIEAPENSATMGFTVESVTDTGYVRVDDVALRDVTDVVRLEEAAKAAADKADAAQAEAEAAKEYAKEYADQQDNKIAAAAAADAQEKADAAAAKAQARAEELNALLAGEVSAKGRAWPRSESPPSPGTHYAWLGERHGSVSVKLDTDGNETARNLVHNPRGAGTSGAVVVVPDYEGTESPDPDLDLVDGDLVAPGAARHVGYNGIVYYSRTRDAVAIRRREGDGGSNMYAVLSGYTAGDSPLATSVAIWSETNTSDFQMRSYIIGATPSADYRMISGGSGVYTSSGMGRGTWVPVNIVGRYASPGDTFYYRVQKSMADTEEAALAQVETYFDGSTVSDRAHDLWYNADGIPHEWINGTNGEPGGWVAISDERIVAATQAAQAAQERADKAEQDAADAHEAAGEAHSHADAAMTRAAEAESTAIAEAKRLAKDAKDRAEEAIAKGKVIDTRNDNQPPSWYRANYRQDSVTEFKRRATMDIPGSGTYVYVTTVVPWTDQSGGPIVQTATIGDVVMSRESVGRGADEEWLEWVDPVAEAKDLAENLPKVLHGTSAPSGTAPDGSIWWQHSGSLRGAVTAQWNRVNGQWVSTPIDSKAIANLDVGKLTAGGATLSSAVIQDLKAANGAFDRLDAREGWIGEVALEDGAVGARVINAQEVFTDEATANIVWAEIVRAGLLTAEEALIGDVLIKKGAVTVDKLHGLEEILTALLRAKKIEADDIAANSVWADEAWLSAVEAASVRLRSVINDWQTTLSGQGMEVISPEGQPTVQLGNFEETGLTLYNDGEATASMSDDGHVSGTVVSANEEFYYQGTELSEVLDLEHMPRGVVAQAVGTGSQGPWYKETGVAYLQFLTIPGRLYKVTINQRMRSDSTGVYIRLKASHTAGTQHGWPSVSLRNTEVGNALVLMSSGYSFRTVTPEFWWTYPNPELLAQKPTRLLFSVESLGSGDRVNPSSFTFTVEDMGLLPETTWSYHRGGSDGGAPPEPDPVKPPKTKTRRTKTYGMSWWRTWWQNGNIPGSGVGVKEAAQGRTPYFTTAGTYRSMIGFPSMTSDLSGADIEKIEVRVRVIHSHSGSGGNVRLGTHNRTSRPSSYTGYSNAESTNTHFGRGQEKWVTLPSRLYNGFKNGTYRGVTMFTSSTSSTYYVQANPSRFAMRVTYRK